MPPCGGHQVSAVHLTASFFVSSRAPVWGASGSEWYNFKFDCVSSRAPVWGASRFLPDCMISTWFQVVPPCGGHPQRLQELEAAGLVSSRAPVWGASKKPFLSRPIGVSFKSCPRVGGISASISKSSLLHGFKSCPRVGGISVYRGPAGHRQVSSRAPVWGASDLHLHLLILVGSFKSCPRVGGILVAVDDVKVVHSFKSCPRVGGIQGKPVICMTMIVSSRAPVWGASYFNRNYVAPRTVSSRAPVWGASLPARWR